MKKKGPLLVICLFLGINNVLADNIETVESDDTEYNEKCPVSLVVKDNIDFSMFNSIFNYDKITDDLKYDFSEVEKYFTNISNADMKEYVNNLVNNVSGPTITTNKYCPVYCAEENDFKFPGYAPITNSGNHFTWTLGKTNEANILNGLTARLEGTKYCVTKVNMEQWVADYKALLKDIDSYIISNPPEIAAGRSGGSGSGACGDLGGYRFPKESTLPSNPYCTRIDTGGLAYLQSLGVSIDGGGAFSGGGATPAANSTFDGSLSNKYTYYFSTNTNLTAQNFNAKNVTEHAIRGASYSMPVGIGFNTIFLGGDTSGMTGYDFSGQIKDFCLYEFEKVCCTWINIGGPTTDCTSECDLPSYDHSSSGKADNVTSRYVDQGCESIPHKKEWDKCTAKYDKTLKRNVLDCETFTSTYYTYKNCQSQYQEILCTFSSGLPDEQGDAAKETVQSSKWGQSPGSASCRSGYRLGDNNTCYWVDTTDIKNYINSLSNLMSQLKNCSTLLENFDYYLDTDMSLEYNHGEDISKLKYGFDMKLEKVDVNGDNQKDAVGQYAVVGESKQISNRSSVSDTVTLRSYNDRDPKIFGISSESVPFYFCDIGHAIEFCIVKEVQDLNSYWNDFYSKTFVATYEYKIKDGTYQWVTIPNAISQSTPPDGDYLKYGRFIDIGHANYPVHFTTPGGPYEGLNVRITNVGYKNYLYNSYTNKINEYNNKITDSKLSGTQQEHEVLYDCYYKVGEGAPYCPTNGCLTDDYDLGQVRLIYRPISLENPFPAMSGNGRDTGSNWCTLNGEKEENCKNNETNENVKNYILNNRNTEGSSIYNKEPMYEIVLNQSLIKKIREYNENTNYDDYNLYCNHGTIDKDLQGKECRSHFVVGGMEETGLPTLASYFEDRCGMNSDFEACNKLDGYER